MQPLAIVIGIAAFLVGAYLPLLARETPEGEMVSWGLEAERSRNLVYLQVASAWFAGVLLILVGIYG